MKIVSEDERKRISYEILCEFDSICRKHNIHYFLAWGTLIGAVRHKGFIPWDDDIDVWVPIKDIGKLFDILKNESKYMLVDQFSDPNWVWTFSKLSDRKTVDIFNDNNCYEAKQTKHGQSIDIFPLLQIDCKNDDRLKAVNKTYRKIYRLFMYNHGIYRGKLINEMYCWIHNIVGRDILYYKSILLKNEYKCNSGNYYYDLAVLDNNIIFPKELFETIELEFEDRYFHAPSGYDEILTRYYGNYRVLPPEIERVTHPSYKTYKVEKSEDSTIEQSRIYPFNCENNI